MISLHHLPVTFAPSVSCPTVADVLSIGVSLAGLSKVLYPRRAGTGLTGAKVRITIIARGTHLTIGTHRVVSAVLG